MTLARGLKILAYKTWLRLKGQQYDEQRALVGFDKGGFQGLAIGILDASRCHPKDIARCSYVHTQNHNGPTPPPSLYWHSEGFLICVCREGAVMDRQGYSLVWPFMCYGTQAKYEPNFVVPDIRPETSLPVLRINKRLLADSFISIIESVEKRTRDGKETEP